MCLTFAADCFCGAAGGDSVSGSGSGGLVSATTGGGGSALVVSAFCPGPGCGAGDDVTDAGLSADCDGCLCERCGIATIAPMMSATIPRTMNGRLEPGEEDRDTRVDGAGVRAGATGAVTGTGIFCAPGCNLFDISRIVQRSSGVRSKQC